MQFAKIREIRFVKHQTPENQTHNNRALAFLPPKSPFVPDLQGVSRQKEGEDREKVGRWQEDFWDGFGKLEKGIEWLSWMSWLS